MENSLDKHVEAYEGKCLYDFDNEIILDWYPRRVVEFSKKSSSLLELGLGHGFTSCFFSSHFKRHVVLDGSPAVIKRFKSVYPECAAEIIETYFENFKSQERFDVIVFGFILEHVDDPIAIMKYYRRFLSPGGKLFLAVPNADSLVRRIGHYAGLLPDMQAMSDNDRTLGHKRYYTVSTLRTDIEAAGYRVEFMEGIYLKPFTTKQIMSLNFDKNILNALCLAGIDYPELSCGILAKIEDAA